jgi:Domain of unknown function (DUF4395)
MRAARTADPYRDTDVIDERAPRFNQAFVGLMCVVAIATGWWPIVGLLALQFVLGLSFGRKFCLACVFYFEVVQPRLGESEIEDARPPRFANILGLIFLSSSTLAHVAGLSTLGWILAGMVATLALLAATTGLCVGCEIYRLVARLRGIGSKTSDELDLAGLGAPAADNLVVHFTHPLCTDCHTVQKKLTAEGHTLVLVDVSTRPELARQYGINVVPTAFAVSSEGRVLERLA